VIPWNKGKTKLNDSGVKKISDTMKNKKIDNFKNWREKARLNGLIPDSDKILDKNVELATLIGLILGDGNIDKLPRTETLRLTLGTDKPELANFAARLITKVFNKTPSIIKRNNSNCFNVTICQKNLSKRLEIPSGARGNLQIKLAPWIWRNKSYLISSLKRLRRHIVFTNYHIHTISSSVIEMLVF